MVCQYRTHWIPSALATYARQGWFHAVVESCQEWHGSLSDGSCRVDRKHCTERLRWTGDYAVQSMLYSLYRWAASHNCSRNSNHAVVRCESAIIGRSNYLQCNLLSVRRLTIVSSIGYVVLSGKMHVDKHETTFDTLVSWLAKRTLSFICIFFR